MKKVFAFRGSPASGKGTITDQFKKLVPGRVAFLELDTFRWGFHLVNRTVPDIQDDEHQLAYENYLSVLENYLRNGSYTVVTEGLFSWNTPSPHGNMQDILGLCEKYGYPCQPILLSAEYDVLWQRNLCRTYAVPQGEFKALYDHVMHETSPEEFVVDVGRLTIDESVNLLKPLIS